MYNIIKIRKTTFLWTMRKQKLIWEVKGHCSERDKLFQLARSTDAAQFNYPKYKTTEDELDDYC